MLSIRERSAVSGQELPLASMVALQLRILGTDEAWEFESREGEAVVEEVGLVERRDEDDASAWCCFKLRPTMPRSETVSAG